MAYNILNKYLFWVNMVSEGSNNQNLMLFNRSIAVRCECSLIFSFITIGKNTFSGFVFLSIRTQTSKLLFKYVKKLFFNRRGTVSLTVYKHIIKPVGVVYLLEIKN